jgi:DNA-binding beta-propeller fold protein YncE
MRRHSPVRSAAAALRLALLIPAFGGAISWAADSSLVWPAAPGTPRIAYVRSIAQPADAGAKQSGLKRFANWVSGAETGNEQFTKPFGIAVDDQGNLCLTDTGANSVSCFDQSTRRWRRWDRAGEIRFASPVAVARKGSLIFVADSALGIVIAFDTGGKLRFRIDHDLERPSGLALSGERLFVADAQQHRVAVFDLNGKFLSRFGRRGAGPGEFNFPTHLATDREGRLFVTDSMNHRVQVFDAAGQFQTQIGTAGDTSGHFGRPKGVAVDTFGHVYVADAAFDNLQIFDGAGRFLLDLGGSGQGPGEFWLPNGVAIDGNNQIYVADSYNRRVQVFKYLGEK